MTKGHAVSIVCRLMLLLYVGAVAVLCFCKFDSLPDIQKTFLGIPTDKIVHFLMFLPFPVLGFFAFERHAHTPLYALGAVLVVASVGCIFAGITEIIQGALPYRSEDMTDFMADCLAVCISSAAVFIIDIAKIRKRRRADESLS